MSYEFDIDPLDPNETPLELEGLGSDEQSEWDSDGPNLSLPDKRLISQQRAVWLSDFYFKYGYEVERYATRGNVVTVRYASERSAVPVHFTIGLDGCRADRSLKESFEAHFSRVIEDDGQDSWKFVWKRDQVIVKRVPTRKDK